MMSVRAVLIIVNSAMCQCSARIRVGGPGTLSTCIHLLRLRKWMVVAILWSQVEGDASVGGEAVEDGYWERGDACFWGVAGRVVEGDQAVGVTGD
jgi:hypothetical protein